MQRREPLPGVSGQKKTTPPTEGDENPILEVNELTQIIQFRVDFVINAVLQLILDFFNI
jgi:hypothetical protein